MRGQSDKITILRILPYRNQPMNEFDAIALAGTTAYP
jgi:hypothetical protein